MDITERKHVAAAALIYVLVRSEIHIHYPGRNRKRQ
jgi:hypothetical protein